MKIVPIHSTADIITNSSTEMFVCRTDKTKDQVKETLEALAKITGIPHGVGQIYVGHGPKDLKKIILKEWILKDEVYHTLSLFFPSYKEAEFLHALPKRPNYEEREAHILTTLGECPDYNLHPEAYQEYRDAEFEVDKTMEKEWVDELNKFFKEYNDKLTEAIGQFVVFEGVTDNSIHYAYFDIFCATFNGTHYHMG